MYTIIFYEGGANTAFSTNSSDDIVKYYSDLKKSKKRTIENLQWFVDGVLYLEEKR